MYNLFMYDIEKCQNVKIAEGCFYLGPSTKEQSVGYLELNPYSSLPIHNRPTGIEKLTQVEGKCSIAIWDIERGRVVMLEEGMMLVLKPKGVWHIHANPSEEKSLTYWDFDGDIRSIISKIRKGGE
ncbi:MAG: cupin domain-containing protein [Candidatus Dojkabacteria bacterium]|nr:cupin domain-containing protein [Candidatus Dojkabacteria bacterium]